MVISQDIIADSTGVPMLQCCSAAVLHKLCILTDFFIYLFSDGQAGQRQFVDLKVMPDLNAN